MPLPGPKQAPVPEVRESKLLGMAESGKMRTKEGRPLPPALFNNLAGKGFRVRVRKQHAVTRVQFPSSANAISGTPCPAEPCLVSSDWIKRIAWEKGWPKICLPGSGSCSSVIPKAGSPRFQVGFFGNPRKAPACSIFQMPCRSSLNTASRFINNFLLTGASVQCNSYCEAK